MADQDKHDKTTEENEEMETTENGILLKELFDSIDITIERNNDSVNDLKTLTTAVALNTAKTGITSTQASNITTNNGKTGITTAQASAITDNTAKTGITNAQVKAITSNTAMTTDLIVGRFREVATSNTKLKADVTLIVSIPKSGSPVLMVRVVIAGTTYNANLATLTKGK